jgi:hypothetical protein
MKELRMVQLFEEEFKKLALRSRNCSQSAGALSAGLRVCPITIPRAHAERLKLVEGDALDVAIRVLKRVQKR